MISPNLVEKTKKKSGETEDFNMVIMPNDINCIFLVKPETETEKYAADELQRYFKKITGIKLPVYLSEKHCQTSKSLILRLEKIREDDEFRINTFPIKKTVVITASNPRSLLYGVYCFLRKVFGIEWTSPGIQGELLKRTNVIKPININIKEKATLKYRGFYVDSAQYSVNASNIGEIIDWMAKNYANFLLVSKMFYEQLREPLLEALKLRGLILEVGHHGFNCYVDPREHFKKHPEWFSEINKKREPGDFFANMIHNSQLCFSNKNVLDFYCKKFMDFFEKNQEIDILGVIPNDGFGWCECSECMKLEPKLANHLLNTETLVSKNKWMCASGRYHHFVNEVSKYIAAKIPEGKKLSFWAYAGVLNPSPVVSEFPENVILSIALFERWYNSSLNDPLARKSEQNVNPKLVDIIRSWRSQFKGEINIYEYYQKYCWQSMPKWIPEIIRKDTLFFKKENIQGLLSMIEKDNFIIYEPNYMAHMAMSWSSKWTSESFLDNYATKSFGSMGKHIKLEMEKIILTMKPFAKPGPRYPKELIQNAEKVFKNLEDNFNFLAEKGKGTNPLSTKSSTKLKLWSKNMKMTYEHFALNKFYYDLSEAIEVQNYTQAINILDKWKSAKRQFYKTYKSLKGSGVCVSDDVWTVGKDKTFFATEEKIKKNLERANHKRAKEFLDQMKVWVC